MSFKPMSAATAEDLAKDVHLPAFVSRKYDGIRFVVRNGVALSKKNKPLPNAWLQALVASSPLTEGLDGEVIVGEPTAKDVWNVSQSFAMSKKKVPADMGGRAICLHVFDWVDEEAGYAARLAHATKLVKKLPAATRRHFTIVEQQLVTTVLELHHWEAAWVLDGYEGIMGRHPEGGYKYGRSTLNQGWLWKYKQFYDAEAIILGAFEQMHNTNEATIGELGQTKRSSAKAGKVGKGVLGGVNVRAINGPDQGAEFDVGTGWTDDDRALLWPQRAKLPGRIITYKAQRAGVAGGMPRFPVVKGFREEMEK